MVVCVIYKFTQEKWQNHTKHGLGYCVVQQLSISFTGKHPHICCNSFFTSLKLCCDLIRDKTSMCGTIQTNH